ncbi:CotS family spore coat protein [Geosporobacter ferrireducens]|uniref:Serine kinase n=1 Tax=Geosporobacter ferrireducens TaxID=1424294 RepID=A0A1D8GKU3_9FIRM|nr:CotS family spore coat protein [Geosporobacter ferrireducens]AOT71528.1 serine kinase [Geosporobacter ferrireducens]MTI57843.1 CotS family spore coat protein [Geosporobacter ferrireducens]
MANVNEEIKEALQQYDITVVSIKNESYKDKKGVWWIQTPAGYKILKKQSQSIDTLNFILDAVEHLKQKGIYIPDVIKTKEDKRIAIINNTCYVLSEAISGKTLTYSNDSNIKLIIQELAKFHKASEGFFPSSNTKMRSHLGEWIVKYREEMHKLEGYYKTESLTQQSTEFGKLILKEYKNFYRQMEMAVNELEKSNYYQWSKEAGDKGCLCHQDFAAGNLIYTESKKLFVLDIDSITMDIPIRDIRKILNKIMKKKGGWDQETLKYILACYHEMNPLTPYQWQVLKATLRYPHLFAGIMSKYYEGRDKSWTQSKYLKRLEEMLKIEKSLIPLLENFEKLLPI